MDNELVHAVGVEQFRNDSLIFASAYSPDFVSPENLPEHSLCKDLNIPTPKYIPKLLSHNQEIRINNPRSPPGSTNKNISLGLIALHTPGHTPDELALWDPSEKMLYVGDTLYEFAHIIFPNEGSIIDWLDSVDFLIHLVEGQNAKISCGHTTAGRPAIEVLVGANEFMMDVLKGGEKVRKRFKKRGEVCEEYVQESMRFGLVCPRRLIEEARVKRGLSQFQS